MRYLFEEKAEPKARNILDNYDYCLVTPLECVDYDFGHCIDLEPIKCTDIETIRDYYNEYYEIMITTPDGCNY